MKVSNRIVLIFVFVAFDVHAFDNYIDINYLSVNNKFGSLKAEPSAYQIRYGVKLNNTVSMEVYYGGSISSDNFTPTFSTEIKELSGFNFVGHYPLNNKASVFAKVGFGALTHESDSGSEVDDLGFTAGIGMNYRLNRNGGINIEYLKMPDVETPSDDVTTSMFVIGYRSLFEIK